MNIPDELKGRAQWGGWRYEWDGTRQRWIKPPYNPATQQKAKPDDPSTWTSFAEARTAAAACGWDGVGYLFTADDPYAGVDLDDCREPETGQLQPWAADIIRRLDSYTETSPSRTGVKIFLRGKLPPRGRRRGGVEMYEEGRYFTVTGHHLPETPTGIEARQAALDALHAEIFGPEAPAVPLPPTAPARGQRDRYILRRGRRDRHILRRARRAKNREKFERLWAGDATGYASDSEADASLCALLAFWGARDPEQLDRLFRQSGLYRPKWDAVHGADGATYGQITIARALGWDAARAATLPAGMPEPAPADDDALAQARALADDFGPRAKADAGAPFTPEAIGALALLHRHDLPAYARARQALKRAGVSLRDLKTALRHARSRPALRLVGPDEAPAPRRVADDLPEAPGPHLLLPPGYALTATATLYTPAPRAGAPGDHPAPDRLVAHAPVLITGRVRDREEQLEAVRLSWQCADGWHHQLVDRGVALHHGSVVALASRGVPVASDTAHEFVRYLHAFEAANDAHLPRLKVSSHLGWQGPPGRGRFLWGRTLIRRTGRVRVAADLKGLPPEAWSQELIAFRGVTSGDEQLADAYRAAGTLAGWTQAVRVVRCYPRVLVALYASFVPPLLVILDVPNFVVDLANRTSTGKTTTLRVAASPWGKPDERAADGALWTWDLTRVWAERAKDPRLVASLLYEVTSGRGRGRGNRTTIERTRTWRTVLLSSGEAPATSFTQDGGTRTRCLEVRGMPFGAATPQTRRVVLLLNRRLQRHHGQAGPHFVEWVLQHAQDWKAWRRDYRQRVEAYTAQAASPEAGRLAQYVAAIDVAARLAHAALDLPWAYADPFEQLWDAITAEAAEASGEERALRDVVSWAHAHAQQFYGRHPRDWVSPTRGLPGGTAGRWDAKADWGFLGFHPHLLRQVLRELGYEPEAILGGWLQRGWLAVDNDRRRYTKKIRVGPNTTHLIVIRRAAIDAVEA